MTSIPNSGGVIKYRTGHFVAEVHLPAKDPGCRYCPFQRKTLDDQYRCELTQHIIWDRAAIDPRCPVEWEDEFFNEL